MQNEVEKVEVISLRRTIRPGQLKGYADVRIGRMEVRNFAIFDVEGAGLRIFPPKHSWEDPRTHEKRFVPTILMPRDIRQRVEIAILDALAKESGDENRRG
jgi:hypothetical protein